jgi:hypothetical protein
MNNQVFKIFLPLLAFLFTFGWSAEASDFHSPRTAALGGSGHAGPLLTDSIYLNPSFISLLPTYGISFNYLRFNAGKSDNFPEKGKSYNLSIQDGRSKLFQAGVGYTIKEDGALLSIGASKAFVQRFGVGVGSKFYFKEKFGSEVGVSDFNLSSSFVATRWLQFALILDNVLQTDEAKEQGFYRELKLGSKVNIMSIFLVYLDPHFTPSLPVGENFGYEAGLEFVLMSDLFLRLGHFTNSHVPFQNARGSGFGAGFGWIGPRLSLDYAYQRVTHSNEGLPKAGAHTLGATVYF